MKKSVWLVVSLLTIVLLVLASCGPATPNTPTTPTTPTMPTTPTTPITPTTPTTPATPAGPETVKVSLKKLDGTVVEKTLEKPKYGGVFIRVYGSTNWEGFDEAIGVYYRNPGIELTRDKLLTGDYTRGPIGTEETDWPFTALFWQPYEVGALAETYEMPNGETIIFHIRKGVHFHNKPPVNGRELTADDVVYSLNRNMESDRSYVRTIMTAKPTSIKALDKYTVEVKCPTATAGALLELLGSRQYIIAPEMVKQYGDLVDWKHNIGTGPFIVADFVSGSGMTLKRNPDYWGKDPIFPDNQLPYLDTVKVLNIVDPSTRLAALRTGKVDWLGGFTEIVGWEDAGQLIKSSPKLQYKKILAPSRYWLGMRTDTKPLDDLRVRRALMMAVNFREWADKYYGGGEIVNLEVAPYKLYMDMYTPLDKLPDSTRELYEYHPDRAKQLLAEAGYPNGFNIDASGSATDADTTLSVVKSYWEAIGVKLNIEVKEAGVLASMTRAKTHKAITPSGSGSPPWLLHTSVKGGTVAVSMVDDPKVEQAYQQMQALSTDYAKRAAIMKDINLYILSQAWFIPIPMASNYMIWQPWVKNYHGEVSIGMLNMAAFPKYLWIDQDLKRSMGGKD